YGPGRDMSDLDANLVIRPQNVSGHGSAVYGYGRCSPVCAEMNPKDRQIDSVVMLASRVRPRRNVSVKNERTGGGRPHPRRRGTRCQVCTSISGAHGGGFA